jgi:hypothetical protein
VCAGFVVNLVEFVPHTAAELSLLGIYNYNVSKKAVFWDVTPCGSCKNIVSEKRIASIIRVDRISELGTT